MTLRTQLTSIWLPIQLGIIVAVAAAAMGIAAIVRKRFDLVSATMSWPPYLRLAVRAVMSHFGTIIFILLLSIVRVSMRASMDRPRTYLLMVAIDLATAWVVINIAAGRDPQPVHQPRGGGVGVDHRGAEHPAPARPDRRRARLGHAQHRRPADHAAGDPEDRRCC